MFPNSKTVSKYQCGRTNTIHMITGEVAKQITSDLKEELLLTRWYGLATDGTSNEDDKFLSLLVRYVDKDSGLIITYCLTCQILTAAQQQNKYMMCATK